MKISNELLQQCCKQLYELYHYQIIFIDHDNHCLNDDYSLNMIPPYYSNLVDYFNDLYKDSYEEIIQSSEGLSYLHIVLEAGRFIIGPVLLKEYSANEIKKMYEGKDYDYLLLKNYYKSIPKQTLKNLKTFIPLYKNIIQEYFKEDYQQDLQLLRNEDIEKQKEYAHLGYNTDKILIECVKNGYPHEIKRFLNDYYQYSGKRELLKGTIRDRRDFSISYISMLCYGAIEGGMDYDYVSSLNLKYIRLIERKQTSRGLEQLEIDILYDLAKAVRKIKDQGYTKLIRNVKDYIKENIALDLKVQEIADKFHLEKKYLATRFKEETKETMKKYIQRKKIEEAKRIMQSSTMSLIEIASILSFYDQSHFSKVFKDIEGMTPKQYYQKVK